MPSLELCILTTRRLSLDEWQRAIDAQDFFVELRPDTLQPDVAAGRWHARLSGQPVVFMMTERPVADLVPDGRALGWKHGFATLAAGDLILCAAAGMALLAYAVATDGAVCDAGAAPIRTFGPLKEGLDAMAAVATGKAAEYEAAHPGEPGAEQGDIVITSSRLV